METRTKHLVVLVHGGFGFGTDYPLWGTFAPYFPEKVVKRLNDHHVIVDCGPISSDHDRACEVFWQLYGGTVDYGDEHSVRCNHRRFGRTYEALHPNWNTDNPVHFVAHSMGATTSIELYQLLCQDYFGVGSDASWIRSIVSIAGPLTGSTLFHTLGLLDKRIPTWSLVRFLASGGIIWHKLYTYIPWLRKGFDLKLDQWDDWTLREMLSNDIARNADADFGMFDTLPASRVERNKTLMHMHKLYLLSVATSPTHAHFPTKETLLLAVMGGISYLKLPRRKEPRGAVLILLAFYLIKRLRNLNLAQVPSIYGFMWLMRRCVRTLPSLFDGFKSDEWEHNDGVVNIKSMMRPWFPKPQAMPKVLGDMADAADSSISQPDEESLPRSESTSSLDASEMARSASHISLDSIQPPDTEKPTHFRKGRWYVYRVQSNHLCGTWWDGGAEDLYKSIFLVIKREYEHEKKEERKYHPAFA